LLLGNLVEHYADLTGESDVDERAGGAATFGVGSADERCICRWQALQVCVGVGAARGGDRKYGAEQAGAR
jgi:hypothetical protein